MKYAISVNICNCCIKSYTRLYNLINIHSGYLFYFESDYIKTIKFINSLLINNTKQNCDIEISSFVKFTI